MPTKSLSHLLATVVTGVHAGQAPVKARRGINRGALVSSTHKASARLSLAPNRSRDPDNPYNRKKGKKGRPSKSGGHGGVPVMSVLSQVRKWATPGNGPLALKQWIYYI